MASSGMRNQLITTALGEYIFPPFLTTPQLFLNNQQPTLLKTTIDLSQERKHFSRENEFQYTFTISPHVTLLENPSQFVLDPSTLHTTLRILVWNCRGARRRKFVARARDLIEKYQPHVFMVLETRLHGEPSTPVIKSLSFPSSSSCCGLGYIGGFWMLYQSRLINVTELAICSSTISMVFSLKPLAPPLQIQPEAASTRGLMEDIETNAEQAADPNVAFWDDVEANAEQAANPAHVGLLEDAAD